MTIERRIYDATLSLGILLLNVLYDRTTQFTTQYDYKATQLTIHQYYGRARCIFSHSYARSTVIFMCIYMCVYIYIYM